MIGLLNPAVADIVGEYNTNQGRTVRISEDAQGVTVHNGPYSKTYPRSDFIKNGSLHYYGHTGNFDGGVKWNYSIRWSNGSVYTHQEAERKFEVAVRIERQRMVSTGEFCVDLSREMIREYPKLMRLHSGGTRGYGLTAKRLPPFPENQEDLAIVRRLHVSFCALCLIVLVVGT